MHVSNARGSCILDSPVLSLSTWIVYPYCGVDQLFPSITVPSMEIVRTDTFMEK